MGMFKTFIAGASFVVGRHLGVQIPSGTTPLGLSTGSSPIAPTTSSYKSLVGKNLVSIDDCLEALQTTTIPTSRGGKVVFVDGSWYHKGDRNGRKE